MNEKIQIGIITYALLQFFALLLYGIDKSRARRSQDQHPKKGYKKNRISERFLLQIAILAPIGALLGMKLFHHKTKKSKFIIWNFLMLIIHVLCLFFVFRYFNG